MLAVEIAVACRSSENLRGSPPLPCQNYTFSGGFLESYLSLAGSQSYLRLFFLPYYSLHYLSFLLERASKPSRDPGYQYQRPLPGLDYLFSFFSLEFRYTRGLYKVSPRVHAFCLCSARVCTRVVLVTVACLTGYFLFRVGQSSPPLIRSIPLRCLSLGLNSQ
jgi:hypothetical protein